MLLVHRFCLPWKQKQKKIFGKTGFQDKSVAELKFNGLIHFQAAKKKDGSVGVFFANNCGALCEKISISMGIAKGYFVKVDDWFIITFRFFPLGEGYIWAKLKKNDIVITTR